MAAGKQKLKKLKPNSSAETIPLEIAAISFCIVVGGDSMFLFL